MGLFASSILVKYSLLNNSGSLVYAGNTSNSLRIWGAQLELAEYSEDILNDYINNYRYVRTTGAAQNFYGIRFGSGVNGDQSVDSVLIGGSSSTGSRAGLGSAENIAFFVDKAPRVGNNYSSSFSGTGITAYSPDTLFVGQQYRWDTRLSGDPQERLEFSLQKRIKDTPGVDGTGVTVSDDRRRIPSNPIFDAARVAGLEIVRNTSQTFSYNRYTPVSGDNVYYNANDWFSEVGRSQRARMAIGGDTEVNFFDKHLDEIKQIPQNPRFDALRVMGLEPVYKTSSIITLAKYTPVHNTDYTYYKRYDWYSEVPRSQRARSALGIGDGSPLMFDNLQFVEDFISLPTKGLFENIVMGYGTTSQTSRLAGKTDAETMKFVMLQAVKRGKDDLYIINNRHQTSSDAIQTQEIFYNKPGSIFGRSWYQLAPYFSNYSTIFDGSYAGDNVRVGDYYGGVRHSNNRQETMAMLLLPGAKQETLSSTDAQTKFTAKTALKALVSSNTLVSVIRTNFILQSERLDRATWSSTGATVRTSSVLLSGTLPYRNISYDADQLHEIFYNRANTYQPRKWYTLVPLATRTSFTSTGISLITVTSSNSQHAVTTAIDYTDQDRFFVQAVYVRRQTGVNRIRLAADSAESHYADFDLSSATVLTSVNISYANIIPRGDGWYLIKILGPISGTASLNRNSLGFNDVVTVPDEFDLQSNLFETFIPTDLNV